MKEIKNKNFSPSHDLSATFPAEKRVELKQIQARLRECIKNSRYTQKEIAKMLNISEQTVSKYMRCNIFPALDTFTNLCIILDVKSDYILCLCDDY